MHKNTPAENANAMPSTISRDSMNESTPNAKINAPNGHINANTRLTINCFCQSQPLAAINDVIDSASNGLCKRMARKTLSPAVLMAVDPDCTAAANAIPSISVWIAKPKHSPTQVRSRLPL